MLGLNKNDMRRLKVLFGLFSMLAIFIASAQGIAVFLENIINQDEITYLVSLFLSGSFMWAFLKVNTDWKHYE